MRSGSSLSDSVGCQSPITAARSSVRDCVIRSRKVGKPTMSRDPSGSRSHTSTRLSGSGYGSGRRSTGSMTLKIAVVAPMANPSVSTETNANAGDRRSNRAAICKSARTLCTRPSCLRGVAWRCQSAEMVSPSIQKGPRSCCSIRSPITCSARSGTSDRSRIQNAKSDHVVGSSPTSNPLAMWRSVVKAACSDRFPAALTT